MNSRQATAEELAQAYAKGEIEYSSEELSLSESLLSSESLVMSLSESQSFSASVFESENEDKPSKEDWLDYFETVNGRKPNLAEFREAKVNGEFRENLSQASESRIQPQPQTSQVSSSMEFRQSSEQLQHTNVQSVFSSSPQDGLGRVIQPDVANAQETASYSVGFVEAFKLFFKNYANFKGKSSRAELGYILVWHFLISLIPLILILVATANTISAVNSYSSYSTDNSYGGVSAGWGAAGFAYILLVVYGLAVTVPNIAIGVRRFRDVGISHIGYIGVVVIMLILSFLQIIPILGSLALFAFAIYALMIAFRPTDYYLTRKEPVTDWIIAHFGKK
ncbi:MAG: DUF805 domain-containing protein [Streptococcaceae bacterium]|jgi:uncharacterized membrane protein YhaH (DUF805 family)|nr:DUF805 domain-containing protein [Streptococcaceae bacterium]